MREIRYLIAPPGRAHEELSRNRRVSHMQHDGLLRRQTPVRTKTILKIGGGKKPKRRVPSRAFPGGFVSAGRDIPALHDLLQKAVFDKALPLGAGQISGPYGNNAAFLKALQCLKRFHEFFCRFCHDLSSLRLAFISLLSFIIISLLCQG